MGKEDQVDYAPLVFPGFSWGNLKGKDHNSFIPRNKGSFLWTQLMGAIRAGAEMIYVAMFDEIDEGTAIFKCAKKVPVGKSTFVPLEEGVESDHYLKLVGEAAKILRKEKAVAFSTKLWIRKVRTLLSGICIPLTRQRMSGKMADCMCTLLMTLLLRADAT